jgi:ATP-binding cassette subfamily C exporter for protease/lipase
MRNEIKNTLLKFKRVFYSIGIFTAVINILMLVPSIYMMEIYDRVLASRNSFTLLMLSVMAIGLYILVSVLEYLRAMVVVRIGAKMDSYLNQRIYTAAFEQNLTSRGVDAGTALQDLTTVRQFVTGAGMFTFFDAPWFPIYLGIIFVFNAWLGVFALVSTAILIGLAWANEIVSRNILEEVGTVGIKSSMLASTNLRNAEVIEAMGMLPNMRSRWYNEHSKFLRLTALSSQQAAKFGAITKFFRTAVQSLILGVAAMLVINGQVTAGMMMAASILLGRAIAPVEQIITVWRQWTSAKNAYKRLEKLLEDNPERKAGMTLPNPKGNVSVEGIGNTVLNNINFTINAGEVLGIVGPSGSGKTTLAKLLVGITKANAGTVRLDSADISKWNKDELGPHIGYLPQDVELFAGTISENIARFGSVDADAVVKAAKLAGVHELILHKPNGYDTVLGVNGQGLSGGEKQRIGLARALFNDPALIVLDEPNSNLDELGEMALGQAIKELRTMGKTVVLITHRPNIISETTKLLVLNQGSVTSFDATNVVLQNFMRNPITIKTAG